MKHVALALALVAALAFPGRGPAHSDRCYGVPRPPSSGFLIRYRCVWRVGWIQVPGIVVGPVHHGG